jgi:hypothetical protein
MEINFLYHVNFTCIFRSQYAKDGHKSVSKFLRRSKKKQHLDTETIPLLDDEEVV